MTESVTPPRAPDPPLVDPETGETAPLSPAREALRQRWLYGEWVDYESDLASHLEGTDGS